MSELERLRDRVEQLEETLGLKLLLPNEFGLTPLEMKMVGFIASREIVNKDAIFNVIYGGLSESDQPDPKTIEVHISKIRRKLSAKGMQIKNYYNVGYYLDPETRTAMKSLCRLNAVFNSKVQGSPA